MRLAQHTGSQERPNYLPEQRPIGSLDISIQPKQSPAQSPVVPGPGDVSVGDNSAGSIAGASVDQWNASSGHALYGMNVPSRTPNAFYKPLYFEEANLERYGSSHGFVQPALSAARFYGTIPLMPYAMAQRPPGRLYSWRWPYPSGAPAPRVKELPPITARGLVAEGAAVSGLIFVIP